MDDFKRNFELFMLFCHSSSTRFILTTEADENGRKHCHALLLCKKQPVKDNANCQGFIDIKRNSKPDNLQWLNYMFKEKKPDSEKWFGYNTHLDADYWLKNGCDFFPTRY